MLASWCNQVFVLVSVVMATVLSEDTKSKIATCKSNAHAYTTLMRYPDGLEVDEGPYCECEYGPSIETKWNVDNGNVLTWQHYERAHWSVQYRFCISKFNDRLKECEGEERAAVMQTEVSNWHIHLPEARCRCPKGKLFQLQGWKKENNLWKYYYNCHKPTCKEKNGTCARISVVSQKDDKGDNSFGVAEMKFSCACAEGYLCPAKLQETDKEYLKENPASFIDKQCESIRQTGKEKSR